MKRSTLDPITWKVDYHTADLANKASRLATQEQRKLHQVQDGFLHARSKTYALPLHKTLALWYQALKEVKHQTQGQLQTTLRLFQSDATALSLKAEGSASQEIPVAVE